MGMEKQQESGKKEEVIQDLFLFTSWEMDGAMDLFLHFRLLLLFLSAVHKQWIKDGQQRQDYKNDGNRAAEKDVRASV